MDKTPALFDERNTTKQHLEFSGNKKLRADVGEVRWYYEGMNIGNEISKDGKFLRPCIILQNNIGNGLLLIMPLTTQYHEYNKEYYFIINNPEIYGIKGGYGILNQTKLIDKQRLKTKLSPKKINITMIRLIIEKYKFLL